MLTVDPTDPTPLYAQLDRGIRAAVASGQLKVGDRLPTVRQLAVDLRVNANTVARVYAVLERAGVLATHRGVGTFVREAQGAQTMVSKRDRDRELRPLVERLLADAGAIGIPLADVVRYLESLESGQTEEN